MTNEAFENAYGGRPTWDIGGPQAAVVRLAGRGLIAGRVLDLGCGTGDNALYLAAWGHDVVGIDFAPAAIRLALAKAAAVPTRSPDAAVVTPERNLAAPPGNVTFLVADALQLPDLGDPFDTVLDVGLFHTLQPDRRADYAASVRSVLRPDGRCLVLAWSDRNLFGYGPERVRQRDLREAFGPGWDALSIEPETLESRLAPGTFHAWLGVFRRRWSRPERNGSPRP